MSVSKSDLSPATYETPITDVKIKITDDFDVGLGVTEHSDPYLTSPQRHSSFIFYLVRGPMYIMAFLWGVLTSAWLLMRYVCCCKPTYKILDDGELTRIFRDVYPWSSLVTYDEAKSNYVLDASVMQKTKPMVLQGYQEYGIVVRWNRQWELQSIEIDRTSLQIGNDSDAWKLAKLYVMHASNYMIKFSKHPLLHFPQDAFIMITNKYLRREKIIRRLLFP